MVLDVCSKGKFSVHLKYMVQVKISGKEEDSLPGLFTSTYSGCSTVQHYHSYHFQYMNYNVRRRREWEIFILTFYHLNLSWETSLFLTLIRSHRYSFRYSHEEISISIVNRGVKKIETQHHDDNYMEYKKFYYRGKKCSKFHFEQKIIIKYNK